MTLNNKCDVHKTYRGKKPPKNDCKECLDLFLSLNAKDRQIFSRPVAIHKDKTKYTRRNKYKDPHRK